MESNDRNDDKELKVQIVCWAGKKTNLVNAEKLERGLKRNLVKYMLNIDCRPSV